MADKITKNEHPSETELVEREARPRDGESVAQSLQRSLLFLQNRRGIAYARLNNALRATVRPTGNINQYRIVCANVTEDLKLVSEGVIALRQALWRDNLPDSKNAVKWLDKLQEFEEQKLITFVSLHTVQRSKDAGLRAPSEEADSAEPLEKKMSRFAKKLDEIDTEIKDLMDEIREFIVDSLEE